MRLTYRQGVVAGQPGFLQIGLIDTRYVDILVDPVYVIATVASGTFNYLIAERRSVTNAWGPFTGTTTQYLYWDVSLLNGVVTRGATTLAPVISATAPVTPGINQHWWDSTNNKMFFWTGIRWQHVLRVFAATLVNGAVLTPQPFASQVNLTGNFSAGYILTDGYGKAYRNPDGSFLTTDTLVESQDTGSLVNLAGVEISAQVNQNTPAFTCVYLVNGRALRASSVPPDHETKAPLGITTRDAYQNDVVSIITAGRQVTNEQWAWDVSDIGKPIYCDALGVLTLNKPAAHKYVKVGTITAVNSILMQFDWETAVVASGGSTGITGVAGQAPITVTNATTFPLVAIAEASNSQNGYMSALTFARLEALEVTKSDVGHTHVIPNVTDLQTALDGKINLITGVPDNFPMITVSGHLVDSGTSAATFALVNHTHAIADVTGLQAALDLKSDVGHGHTIPQVTGLQTALDLKSDIGHTHVIPQVTGLQTALDGKANVIHLHALADLTDVNVTTVPPVPGDYLKWDNTTAKWIPGAVSTGGGITNHDLNYHDDVTISTPNNDDVLTYVGSVSDWRNVQPVAFWFQVGVPGGTHVHVAPMTVSQVKYLIQNVNGSLPATDPSQPSVVITSMENAGHTHELTVYFNYADHSFIVTNITNNTTDNHLARVVGDGTELKHESVTVGNIS